MKKYLFIFSLIIVVIISVVFLKYYADEISEKNKVAITRKELTTQKRQEVKESNLNNLFENGLQNGGQWLLQNQKEDGSFNYERNISTGEITESENNIVRQSGTLYGVAKLYDYTRETRYKDALLKGFRYFDVLAETKEIGGISVRYFKEQSSVQANTVALQILAYLQLSETDNGLPANLEQNLKEMVNFIKLSQQDSGAFQNYFLNNIKIECWESDYNNGESFFALTRYYKYSADSTLLPLLEKSANYFIDKYKDYNGDFYSWGVMGFALLYDATNNSNYKNYIYSITDKMINDASTNFIGLKYYLRSKSDLDPLPDYSQIVQTEGLLYVYKVAVQDNPDKGSFYKDAIVSSLAFHAVFQSPWEETLPKRIYDVVNGGFCNRSDCSTQRIDMVHHALSAFIDALEFIRDDDLRLSMVD